DQVALLGDHVVDVGREVGDRGGLCGGLLDAEVLLGGEQAVVAGLVEGLVVPAAGIRDHAGLVIARGAAGIAATAAVGLLVGGAAGGEGPGAGAGQGQCAGAAVLGCSFAQGRGRELG